MDKLAFAPLIDVPLVVCTVALFIWHFNRWASRNDLDTSVDLAARLPTAGLRVIALFTCILLLCWLSNIAVWPVFALLLGVGVALAFIAGGDGDGGEVGLWAAAYLIREWAFGFPQFILHPPKSSVITSTSQCNRGELMGKIGTTTSPIRPTGDAEIDGVKVTVASTDGRLIETGTQVSVTAYRNGRPCVSPRSHNQSGEEESHASEPPIRAS